MKKTTLRQAAMKLALVAFVLLAPLGLMAQTTITIGEGTSTQRYPLPGYYGYQYDVFIYTPTAAAALGADCDISSIAFNVSTNNTDGESTLQIWVKDVDADYALAAATTFSEYTEGATLVYENDDLSTTTGWNTFDFSSTFSHEGGKALLVAVRGEGCGTNACSRQCYYTSATNTWWQKHQDNSDPGTSISGSISSYRANIQLEITYTGTVCLTPSGLAASGVTHEAATLSWTENGSETGWVLQYGTDNTFASNTEVHVSTTPSYDLSGLTATTTYYARVKPNCDNDDSHWSTTASFSTTAVAEAVGDRWSDDFEGGSCDWDLINGTQSNKWSWGTAANNGGTNGLYVSNDAGTTNAYSHSATTVFATKLLNFAQGKYEFSYDWICNGESNYDYLRVALVPASATLTAGTTPSGLSYSAVPSGWVALDGGSKLNLQTSWQSKSVAINVAAGNYYLVLAWKNDGGGGSQPPAAIDNVNITRLACTHDVEGLAVTPSSITTTGATITWTAGEADRWQVSYSTANNFENPTEETVADATYDMAHLDPSTIYYVRVRAYCGGSDYGSWSDPISFPTECEAVTIDEGHPYTENFDGTTASSDYTPTAYVLPICWSYINNCTYSSYKYYPVVSSYSSNSYAHSGTNYMKFYSYYSSSYSSYDPQPQYAILPEMGHLDDMRIKLQAKGYNATSTFKIGRMTDPTDASTFDPIEIASGVYEQTLTTSYQEFTYNLRGVSGDYIAIMIDAATSSRTSNGVYIDDITVEMLPNCLEPSGLEVVNNSITTNSVQLQWTAGDSGEEEWDIYYSTTNSAPTGSTEPSVTATRDNPATVSGLTAATTYYVWVRAHCSNSDQSQWIGGISFATECAAISSVGYSANFDSYTSGNNVLPICWTHINTTSYSSYQGYPKVYNYNSNSSPNCLYFYSYYSSSYSSYDPQPQYAIMGEMTDLAGKQITLQARGSNTSSTFKVGTMTDPTDAATFTEITSSPDNPASMTTSYQEYTFYIPGNTTDRYVAIMIEAANSTRTTNGVYIDDIVFSVTPTCWQPQNLTASDVTNESATLTWQRHAMGDETAWVLQYSTDNTFATNTTTENVNTNPTYTIDGALNATTTYYVRVKPACDNDGNLWSDAINFTTEASCMVPNNLAISDVTAHAANLNWNGNNDSYTLRYHKATTAPVNLNETYDFDDNTMQGWTTYDEDGDSYSWSLSTSDAHSGSYCLMGRYNGSAVPNNWLISPEIPLGGTLRFYAKGYSYSDGEQFQVYVSTTGTAIANFSAISAVIDADPYSYTLYEYDLSSYSGNGYVAIKHTSTADQYYLYVDDITYTNTIPGVYEDWVTVNNATKPYSFSDLEAETYYEAQVNGHCNTGDVTTNWSDAINFTTTIACPAPTSLAYANVTGHTANLTWNVNGNPTTNYVLTKNGVESNIVVSITAGVASYSLTGLDGETEYTVSVRANCGNLDGYSLESNEVTFTTQITCAAPSALTASNETTTTMDLSWTNGDGEEAWVIAYKKEGDANFTEENVTTNPYELTGLTDGKTYTLKVRANCGNVDGLSQWSGEITHATVASCSTPTNVAYSDVNAHGATITWDGEAANHDIEYRTVTMVEFDETYDLEGGSMPTGWTHIGSGSASYNSDHAHSTTHSIKFSGATSNNVLVLPDLGAEINIMTISYWSQAEGSSSGSFDMGYVTDPADASTFQAIHTNSYADDGSTYKEVSNISLSAAPAGARIAFRHRSGSTSWFWFLDDINITYTAVSGYGAWQTVDDVTSPYELNTLNSETIYEVRVIGDCGATTSPYSDTVSFTTQIACYPVTNVTITGKTTHSVTFTWEDTHDAGAYIVKEGDNVLTGETAHSVVIDATHLTATISGLDEGAPYDEGTFKVFANCGANGNSTGVNVPAFTTPCSAVTDFPWTEDFEGYTANSSTSGNNTYALNDPCWENKHISGTGTFLFMVCSSNMEGNNTHKLSLPDQTDGTMTKLVLPGMTLPNDSYQFSIDVLRSSSTYGSSYQTEGIRVFVSTNGEIEGATELAFIPRYYGASNSVIPAESTAGWYTYKLNLGVSGTCYIILRGESKYSAATYMDNFKVGLPEFEKSIEANKWYAISSPVHNSGDNETLAGVTNLTSGTYDLYGFTESTGTWDKPTTTLDMGKGYIYRAAAAVTLRFVGVPNSGMGYSLSYACSDNNIKGFNLVGNPYPQAANPGMDCYSLTPSGTWHAEPNYTAAVCEAVLVKTNGNGNYVSFTPSGAKGVTRTPDLAFTVSNEKYEDVAYVRFDNGDELPKIGHLEPNAPALSIPVNGKQYAIANLDSDCESFVMNFSGMGDYTISASGEVAYLHLIDKVTGSDIDLLSQPTYSFKANMGDLSSRFLVKLVPNGKGITDGDFAFRNGNGWTVEGEGTLEAYDAMGRLLFAQEISSSSYQLSTSHFPSAGVYILRLGGNSQKIVVTK